MVCNKTFTKITQTLKLKKTDKTICVVVVHGGGPTYTCSQHITDFAIFRKINISPKNTLVLRKQHDKILCVDNNMHVFCDL